MKFIKIEKKRKFCAKNQISSNFLVFFSAFRSLAVVGQFGFRLFSITSVERVEEIFCSHNEDAKIAERLFSSSLVAVVTSAEADKLKVLHNSAINSEKEFKKNS